jgi:hypothetical protein
VVCYKTAGAAAKALKRPYVNHKVFASFLNTSSADQAKQDRNHCHHQKDMNNTAHTEYKGAQYPTNDEDYS